MNLEKLQHSFLDFIIKDKNNPEFLNLISSDSPQDLLKIYQRNVKFNLQGAIQTHFTSLSKYLEDSLLEEITFACINQYPSKSGNLDDYMEFFLEYIENNINDVTIQDLAKLDFHYWSLYSKPDIEYIDYRKFQSIPPESLPTTKFTLNPDLRFIKLNNNESLKLWGELNDNKYYQNIMINKKVIRFIGYKYKLDVIFIPIDNIEHFFLEKISENYSLEDVYNNLLEAHPDCKFDKIINKFISNHTICSFTIY